MPKKRHNRMKVALVHHWLPKMRGGERVLEAMCEMFPDSDIFTLVMTKSEITETINKHKITTSFIQNMPFGEKKYRIYLPLMPIAVEQFDLREYDIVISSDASVVKGVITRPDTLHISYCHSPIRYAWDMYHEYLNSAGLGYIKRKLMPIVMNYIRNWDFSASQRVDYFVSNSRHTANRIKKYYRRSSVVISPPVDIDQFKKGVKKSDYYLFLGQLTPYKGAELAVETFNKLQKKLIVAGSGERLSAVKKLAGDSVKVMGGCSRKKIIDLLSKARALIFPCEEDFGIVPVEAQASGTPVIAYGRGGALETINGVFTGDIPTSENTGIWFRNKSIEGLSEAIDWFESFETVFSDEQICSYVKRFNKERYKTEMGEFIQQKWNKFVQNGYTITQERLI